jgi:hypothetical protein
VNRVPVAWLAVLLTMASGCQTASTFEVVSTGTPVASQVVCLPSEPDCIGPLAPGVHASANLLTPVRFEVREGWSRTLDVPGSLNLETEMVPAGRIAIVPDWAIAIQSECSEDPEPGVGRTVDDLAQFVAEHPGLLATDPREASVGGLSGRTVDIARNADWSGPCPAAVSLFTHQSTVGDPGWWDIEGDYAMRLYFLDGGEHVVTVHLETSDANSFEALLAAAMPIVESLEFEVRASAADLGVATVSADACSLEPAGPITVEAGDAELEVRNETEFQAAFDVWRIDDDRTFEDLVAHVDAERTAAEAGSPGLGHPGFLSGQISSGILEAGASKPVTGDVTPGTWAVVCLSHFDAVTDDPFRPSAVLGPLIVEPT